MAYLETLRTFDKIHDKVIVPYNKGQLNWPQLFSPEWTIFLTTQSAEFDNHYPPNKLVKIFEEHLVCFPKIISLAPLDCAFNVFTDGSSNGIAAAVTAQKTVR